MADQDDKESLSPSDEWYWYDKSRLAFWLRYDTWPVELGLCLICDIDPEKSEELDFDGLVDMVNIKPEDKPSYALYGRHCLLSEDPIYILEPKKRPIRYDFTNAKQYLKGRVDMLELQYFKEDRDDIKPEYVNPDYTDICDRIKLREAARMKQMECRVLFKSNPKHSEQERFAPSYFIEWAASKNIEIPWLEWAKHNGHLDKGAGNTQPQSKAPPAIRVKKTSSTENSERREEQKQEITELREAAKKVAVKLKRDGIPDKRITVERVCQDLLTMKFSSEKPFTSRWRTVSGMRSYLKGEHHPKESAAFRSATSTRAKFNPS